MKVQINILKIWIRTTDRTKSLPRVEEKPIQFFQQYPWTSWSPVMWIRIRLDPHSFRSMDPYLIFKRWFKIVILLSWIRIRIDQISWIRIHITADPHVGWGVTFNIQIRIRNTDRIGSLPSNNLKHSRGYSFGNIQKHPNPLVGWGSS